MSELTQIIVGNREVSIGACVTHDRLAGGCETPDLRVLAETAGCSANPIIRRAATIGGNLCAVGCAAADLGPALLCPDAEVDIATGGEIERMRLDAGACQ